MKFSMLKFNGKEYPLFFNNAAKFELEAKCDGDILESMNPSNSDGCNFLYTAACEMSQQAELCRRYFGYDPEDVLTKETLMLLATQANIAAIYKAVLNAVMLGVGRDIEDKDGDTVDLIMLEVSKKKE